jgi:hypothetical protein
MRAFLLFAAVAILKAQQNTPHAGYVYPAGGRQGETVDVTVGGQFLDGATTAIISGPGIQAGTPEMIKLLTQGQINRLRDQLQELMEKKKAGKQWTPDEQKTVDDLRKKVAGFIRPMTPALADRVNVQLKLDPDAPPGPRQLRLVTPIGITNPITFIVGQLPEFTKPAAPVAGDRFRRAESIPKPTPTSVADIMLPTVINGQIPAGGVDRYRLTATKGQNLVIAAAVRQLIPYISDAVPGWFQASIALLDATGKEVAWADHYGFQQDPVLHYQVPADGQYTLQIHDSIYRGREDFVYRISIGEIPYITSIFPLGGKAGTTANLEVRGWNLPTTRLTQDNKSRTVGVYPISLAKSNSIPFEVDTLPEITVRGTAQQRVKLPVIVNGRIDKPGEQHVLRFEGKAGEEIVAEVIARRLDSPLDSILKLTDAKGKQIAINVDFEDKSDALITHHADSFLQIKLPSSGAYLLSISDNQRKGGPDYAYRLRISHPQPDYQLRVTPSSISSRGGLSVPISVYAIRKDGFNGEIEVKLKDAPGGFNLNGAWIPAGQSSVRMTLTLPSRKTETPVDLKVEGIAKLDGKKETRRLAVPAEDMMQAFYYHHLVAEDAWLVRITNPARGRQVWKVMNDKPVALPLDGTAPPVKVALPLGSQAAFLQLALNNPPEGIKIDHIGLGPTGVNIFLKADAKAKPGLAGNLLVDAFLEIENPNNANAKKRKVSLGTLPAIPFTVTQ